MSFRRGPLVALAVAFAVALTLFFLQVTQRPLPAPPASTSSFIVEVPPPPKNVVDFSSPRAPLKPDGSVSYTQGCIQFWNDLRALDTRDRKGLPEGGRCSSIPPELTQRHEAYLKECVKSQRSDSFECEQALLTYRVHLGEWLTQNTKLAEIHDQKVLTDKLMARLDLHSNTKVTEVAKRLLELNPDMMPAAQALLTSALMEAQEAIGNPRDDRWSAVEEALLRNEKISGNARQAMDVSLMVEQQRYRDPIRLREKASEVSRSHPELGIGPYYAAWAEKQNGDEVRAKELLEEAVRREPNDPRFREALRTMNFQPAPITFALQP